MFMPDTNSERKHFPDSFPDTDIKKPKMYAVIMHNDDYTTMDFVVEVLMKIFRKTIEESTAIMLDIHRKGSRAVQVYTYDIAVTKANMALSMASDRGFPLMVTVKEAME